MEIKTLESTNIEDLVATFNYGIFRLSCPDKFNC
jgi:hypothetical protein